jgi:hypothetical protein
MLGFPTRRCAPGSERETVAALPVTTGATTDDVFAGVEWRRLRLRQDQQVQEWTGVQRF